MMEKFGFLRVAACSPLVRVADIDFNVSEIISQVEECVRQDVAIALFPELAITGYTCADLFDQSLLIEKVVPAVRRLAGEFRDSRIAIVVGAPISHNNRLYNCGVVLQQGEIKGIVPKTHIPNYGEFYERRWFSPADDTLTSTELCLTPAERESDLNAGSEEQYNAVIDVPMSRDLLFDIDGVKFGIELCEDMWVPNPPSGRLCMSGADVILNLSATNELIGKHKYLIELIRNQSARCRCGYVYASAGAGESSTDLAFAGNCIIAENGSLLAESERFVMNRKMEIADLDIQVLRHDRTHFNTFRSEEELKPIRTIRLAGRGEYQHTGIIDYRLVNPHPFLDSDPDKLAERCDEISSIQAWGLAIRLRAIGCRHAVVGISGGLDSTLALLVTAKAFDMLGLSHEGIIGVTMPGFGTTDRTHSNASALMRHLEVTELEIPIGKAVEQHFSDIGHDGKVHDVTYENSQARERTQILMDLANKYNGIVIGTGDLSELALGWCTYNGDQMSMYGVNASIPKTLVKYLVRGYALNATNPELQRVLEDIINTPISPELLPPDSNDKIQQKTEDLVGPYELHDFFIYNILRYGMEPKKVLLLAKTAFEDIYDEETITHWLSTFYRRFFNQQFKRSCMPDGIKAGSVTLSPRGDWRMPSDAASILFREEL
ncbi:MAG: NAD(+) synthase [Lepagella sp.]